MTYRRLFIYCGGFSGADYQNRIRTMSAKLDSWISTSDAHFGLSTFDDHFAVERQIASPQWNVEVTARVVRAAELAVGASSEQRISFSRRFGICQ